ncbi:hypothetical protein JCM10450v2_002956 [Rhodotorula kratochvilovae]
MSDTLSILTADDPPVPLAAPRLVLAANSKVFAHMLSLPATGTNDQPITVAGTKADFEPFLRALEGEEVNLSSLQWETFAQLGDKYDAFVVKHMVEKRIWELEAKQIEHLHSFTLATIVGNKELLDRTALRALRVKDRKSARFGAAQEWKDRLELYNAARTAVFFGFLQTMARAMTTHRHTLAHCYMVNACMPQTAAAKEFVAKIVVDFDPASTELSFNTRWEAQGWKETTIVRIGLLSAYQTTEVQSVIALTVLLTASRTVLSIGSKVFADMLSLPPPASNGGATGALSLSDNSVTITEKKDVVEPFLKVLEGKDVGELEDETWEELARVGDKYDSFVVQILIEKRIWMLEAQDDKPLHSYTLASIFRTAYRALAVKNRSMDKSFGAAQEWKHRLDWWEAMRTCLIVTLLQQVLVEVDRLGRACTCEWGERCTNDKATLNTVVVAALKSLAIDSTGATLASKYTAASDTAEMPTFADACCSI